MAYDDFTAKMVSRVHELEKALVKKDLEIATWKVAHAEVVRRNRLLRNRLDLPPNAESEGGSMINRCDKDMDASMEVEVHGRWVRYEEHVQALAEKDQEIAYLQSERLSAAAMGDQRDREYHVLMEQAVRFAECLQDKCVCQTTEEINERGDCAFVVSRGFLASPEVQAWRERKGEHAE